MIEMLKATFFTTTEELCNQLLKRDPITLQHLERLSGTVIEIQLTTPELSLFLLPNADGFQLQSVYQDQADATATGSAADFLHLMTSKDKADAMFGKTIHVSGDSALITRLQEILADAHIDWEMMLADIIGELPAHQLALYAAWKASWYKSAGRSVLANLDEYLKEEVRFIPTRPEVESYYTEIDVLKERVERLGAKIESVKSSLPASK
jgi:ubiquinone biosynthesis protein UbiJ